MLHKSWFILPGTCFLPTLLLGQCPPSWHNTIELVYETGLRLLNGLLTVCRSMGSGKTEDNAENKIEQLTSIIISQDESTDYKIVLPPTHLSAWWHQSTSENVLYKLLKAVRCSEKYYIIQFGIFSELTGKNTSSNIKPLGLGKQRHTIPTGCRALRSVGKLSNSVWVSFLQL